MKLSITVLNKIFILKAYHSQWKNPAFYIKLRITVLNEIFILEAYDSMAKSHIES